MIGIIRMHSYIGITLLQIHFLLPAAGSLPHVSANRPRIRLGPLTAHRKPFRVPHAPIGLQVFQPIDVALHELTQRAFYGKILLDEILHAQDFVGRQIFRALVQINLHRRERFFAD